MKISESATKHYVRVQVNGLDGQDQNVTAVISHNNIKKVGLILFGGFQMRVRLSKCLKSSNLMAFNCCQKQKMVFNYSYTKQSYNLFLICFQV